MSKEHAPQTSSLENTDQSTASLSEQLGIPEGSGSAHPDNAPTSIYEGDGDLAADPTPEQIRRNRQERGIDVPARSQLKRSAKRLVRRVVSVSSRRDR